MNYNDYVHTKKLNLNLVDIKNNCSIMHDFILDKFGNERKVYPSSQSTETTILFPNYNILLYPLKGFHDLFKEIRLFFRELNSDRGNYYLQSWLNVYKTGDFIYWHNHYPAEARSWHGFYCVSIPEESATLYKVPSIENVIYVPSEENLLVLSKSDGDVHRSTENKNNKNRITIAFDIVPEDQLDPYKLLNHWIPL